MTQQNELKTVIDDRTIFWGIIWGVFLGIILGYLNLPKNLVEKRQALIEDAKDLRNRIEPTDSVADSIATGKEVATRRQQDLKKAL